MNLLTLISQEILDITPRIDADLNGCWRLEERILISEKGSEQIYARSPEAPGDLFLRIGKGMIAHFRDDSQPSGEQWGYAFVFNPKTALIYNKSDNHYLRVELLTAQVLTLLDLGELGSGTILRERFERM